MVFIATAMGSTCEGCRSDLSYGTLFFFFFWLVVGFASEGLGKLLGLVCTVILGIGRYSYV